MFKPMREQVAKQMHEKLIKDYAPRIDPNPLWKTYLKNLADNDKTQKFNLWYQEVISPLSIPKKLAKRFFFGEISALEFAKDLNPTQQDQFLAKFQNLQNTFCQNHPDWKM